MKMLLVLALVLVVVGGGLKMAGARLPLIDYPLGPMGADAPGPGMPDIEVRPPGFDDFGAP
ncbi:MAG: hypothetical protein M3439_13440 [Chloroflexota bacterium]|nr:hypothetical protein [Chloroflexota bacterium]